MRISKAIIAVMLLPMLLAGSCSKSSDKTPVADVADRTITLAAYEKAYHSVDPKFLPEGTDLRKHHLQDRSGFCGVLESLEYSPGPLPHPLRDRTGLARCLEVRLREVRRADRRGSWQPHREEQRGELNPGEVDPR